MQPLQQVTRQTKCKVRVLKRYQIPGIVLKQRALKDERERRENLLSAVERRGVAASQTHSHTEHARGKPRPVRSLRDTCAETVAGKSIANGYYHAMAESAFCFVGYLCQPTLEARSHLKHLVYTSTEVAELLLAQLIATQKLERSSMRRLADSW